MNTISISDVPFSARNNVRNWRRKSSLKLFGENQSIDVKTFHFIHCKNEPTKIHSRERYWRQNENVLHMSRTREFLALQNNCGNVWKLGSMNFLKQHFPSCLEKLPSRIPSTFASPLKLIKLGRFHHSHFWECFQNGQSNPYIFNDQAGKAIQ